MPQETAQPLGWSPTRTSTSTVSSKDVWRAAQLLKCMEEAGLGRSGVPQDGRIRQFATTYDNPGQMSGWCVFDDKGPSAFGMGLLCESAGSAPSCGNSAPKGCTGHMQDHHRRLQEPVGQLARTLWRLSPPALFHEHLQERGLLPLGARLCTADTREAPFNFGRDLRGWLLIPGTLDRTIHNLQAIAPSGETWCLPGGRRDVYCPITSRATRRGPLYVVAGWTFGAWLHMVTQSPVSVAFDPESLADVALNVRVRNPNKRIVIAADDEMTPMNPSRHRAIEAAAAVARLVGAAFTALVWGEVAA